ncbi:hypothetical protein B296_00048996, partial [Ensete ventricosum]
MVERYDAHTGLNQQCLLNRHGGETHLLGPSTSGYGANHRPIPTPAHAFDSSLIDPHNDTLAKGVTSSLELGAPLEAEPPQRQVTEARAASPTPTPARSQSRSCNPVQTRPNFDALSSDTADSLREQVRQVHQRLDEVQKEVLKSRGEIGESSKGSSPFTLEIQGKPLPATFRLPTLESYDGSGDPTEHTTAFRAQMALYDTSKKFQTSIHPDVLDGTEIVEVLLVADRATARNPTEDVATGALVHGRRDFGGRQAGRDEAPPGGAAPRTPPPPPKRREDKSGMLPARPT